VIVHSYTLSPDAGYLPHRYMAWQNFNNRNCLICPVAMSQFPRAYGLSSWYN